MTIRKLMPVFLLLLVMLVALFPAFVMAQEATETPPADVTEPAPTLEPTAVVTPEPPVEPPEELPPTPPEDVLSRLLALLNDVSYIAWAAAGVVIITGAFKTVAFLFGWRIEGVSAAFLALLVQVLIWLGYSIANSFGLGEVFRTQYLNIIEVIRSLLPLVGSIFGGHVLYQAAAARRVPVLGFYPPPIAKVYKQADAQAGTDKEWKPTHRQ